MIRKAIFAAFIGAGLSVGAMSAAAAPVNAAGPVPAAGVQKDITPVRWRGRGGWHRGGHRRGGWHRRGGFPLGAIIGGLAAGAIARSTAPTYYYRDRGGWDWNDIQRCERRFRSFDRSSGTYTTYGGDTRLCPYLR